jgi:hypothetical protein
MNKQALIAVAVVSAGLAGVIGFQAGLFLTRPSREKTATEIASIKAEASEKSQASEIKYKELDAKNMSLAKENARQASLIRDEEELIRELNKQMADKERSLVFLQKEKEAWQEKAKAAPITPLVQKPQQEPVTVKQSGPFNVGDSIVFPNEKYSPLVIRIIDNRSLIAEMSNRHMPMQYPGGYVSPAYTPGPTVVFQNINTNGLVSDRRLDLKGTYKVTSTTEALGQTVFVLEPVQ